MQVIDAEKSRERSEYIMKVVQKALAARPGDFHGFTIVVVDSDGALTVGGGEVETKFGALNRMLREHIQGCVDSLTVNKLYSGSVNIGDEVDPRTRE